LIRSSNTGLIGYSVKRVTEFITYCTRQGRAAAQKTANLLQGCNTKYMEVLMASTADVLSKKIDEILIKKKLGTHGNVNQNYIEVHKDISFDKIRRQVLNFNADKGQIVIQPYGRLTGDEEKTILEMIKKAYEENKMTNMYGFKIDWHGLADNIRWLCNYAS